MNTQKHSGGSMPSPVRITILLLIAILLIIVGFALFIPDMITYKWESNEAGAISMLRTINSAQELYYSRNEYLGGLEELERAKVIDSVLASATRPESAKSGYYYRLTIGQDRATWTCIARPSKWHTDGRRNFMITEEGIIFYNCEENSSEFLKELGG